MFEQMPNFAFRLMSTIMAIKDFFDPSIDQRVESFGIRESMTVVDYGCGPGRYTTRFARLVDPLGRVYAVNVQRLVIETIKDNKPNRVCRMLSLILAQGYKTEIPGHIADVTCAIDIFFGVRDPSAFLRELQRITKTDGFLIIDDGHQYRQETLRKIQASGG